MFNPSHKANLQFEKKQKHQKEVRARLDAVFAKCKTQAEKNLIHRMYLEGQDFEKALDVLHFGN